MVRQHSLILLAVLSLWSHVAFAQVVTQPERTILRVKDYHFTKQELEQQRLLESDPATLSSAELRQKIDLIASSLQASQLDFLLQKTEKHESTFAIQQTVTPGYASPSLTEHKQQPDAKLVLAITESLRLQKLILDKLDTLDSRLSAVEGQKPKH